MPIRIRLESATAKDGDAQAYWQYVEASRAEGQQSCTERSRIGINTWMNV
jgi:hypothetical protein